MAIFGTEFLKFFLQQKITCVEKKGVEKTWEEISTAYLQMVKRADFLTLQSFSKGFQEWESK